MAHTLPKLGYDYNALEPFIDEQTMKIHHTKHHQAYVDKLNAAIGGTELESIELDKLLKDLDNLPDNLKTPVRNHGGGHSNHTFFWSILKKDVPAQGKVFDAITKQFGSLDKFKEEFTKAAATLFGSGWAWLVKDGDRLEIIQTHNQDSPITLGKTPLISLDVWEHAYYLKYMNKRPEYINAFFNIINWKKVDEYFE